jgi:DNA-binding NtrC family response regulator
LKLKIYYLDDELDLLELFSDVFTISEVDIITFSDPSLAMQAIKSDPPDLLFLDYRLPNMTGDQIALQLDPALKKVLVTGDLSVKLESNFAAIFKKPFPIQQIKDFIKGQLG